MLTSKFEVKFLTEAADFLDKLDYKTKEKIIYNIHKAQISQDNKLFKKLNEEIWEFRTLYNKKYYRLFAFWDKSDNLDTLVIATHGLIKKTNKISPVELDKAERYRKQYLEYINQNK